MDFVVRFRIVAQDRVNRHGFELGAQVACRAVACSQATTVLPTLTP